MRGTRWLPSRMQEPRTRSRGRLFGSSAPSGGIAGQATVPSSSCSSPLSLERLIASSASDTRAVSSSIAEVEEETRGREKDACGSWSNNGLQYSQG